VSLVSDEVEVRSYGDFAVVTGRGNLETYGKEYRPMRFTHVWRWQNGKWTLVAAHESTTSHSR
jgi:hypothetical protein